MDKIKVYKGDVAVDDRGTVSFVNEFDFKDVKRFYMVENFKRGFVRAWHGHKKEGKYVTVVNGAAVIGIVDLTDLEKEYCDKWNNSSDLPSDIWKSIIDSSDDNDEWGLELCNLLSEFKPKTYVISSKKPCVIWIPPGHMNGSMTLEKNTKIMYLSTKGLGESEGDDYRLPWDTWYCWDNNNYR